MIQWNLKSLSLWKQQKTHNWCEFKNSWREMRFPKDFMQTFVFWEITWSSDGNMSKSSQNVAQIKISAQTIIQPKNWASIFLSELISETRYTNSVSRLKFLKQIAPSGNFNTNSWRTQKLSIQSPLHLFFYFGIGNQCLVGIFAPDDRSVKFQYEQPANKKMSI